MKLHKKSIIITTCILLLVLGAWALAANQLVDQKGVLSGQVLADRLVVPGTTVREGDVLALVNTLTGPRPAARANVDGIVREVSVKPGDLLQPGEVVARIEPLRK
jgi:biotin carboxyl carrier protein